MLKRSKPVWTAVLTLASIALISSAVVQAKGNSAGKGKGAEKAQAAHSAPGHTNSSGKGHANHKGNGYGHGPHEAHDGDESSSGKNKSKSKSKGKSKGKGKGNSSKGSSKSSSKGGSSSHNPIVDVPEATNSCAIYYAGQHTPVGSVCVSVDGDQLVVDYIMEGDWLVSGTHLWVGDTLASAPRTKSGNPIPGQFPYHGSSTPTDVYTYTIPLSQLNVDADALCTDNSTLLIGAHGSVSNGSSSESAWAGETRFTEKGNWATYFGVLPDCGGNDEDDDDDGDTDPVQVCTVWAASVEYSGNLIDNATPTLSSISNIGPLQEGVVATFSVSANTRGPNPGLLISASTILPPDVIEQSITFAGLSTTMIDGSTAVLGEPYQAPTPAEGEFKAGTLEHPFGSFTLPLDTVTPFSVDMEIEVCSTKLTDPPIAS